MNVILLRLINKLQTLSLNVNPQLFLDTLLLEIRRESIKYSSAKKRERVFQEQLLRHDIEALENQMHQVTVEDNFQEFNNELQIKKQVGVGTIKYFEYFKTMKCMTT